MIVNEIRFEAVPKTSSNNNTVLPDVNEYGPKGSNVTDGVSLIDESNTLIKITDALIKNRIGDYVAVKHHEEDKVAKDC